jgi:hypothetical protein
LHGSSKIEIDRKTTKGPRHDVVGLDNANQCVRIALRRDGYACPRRTAHPFEEISPCDNSASLSVRYESLFSSEDSFRCVFRHIHAAVSLGIRDQSQLIQMPVITRAGKTYDSIAVEL